MGTKAIDEPMCRRLTNRGYTVVNINYRLAPQYKFPAAVNDSLGAVIWARHNAADFSGDPEKLAVMGGSAGGNLAAMVALAANDPFFQPTYKATDYDAKVQAAVLIFPVLDMTAMSHPGDSMKNPYIGAHKDEAIHLFKKASPIFYLDDSYHTPTMLICGDKDGLYPQSVRMAKKLTDMDVMNYLYTASGKGHGFTNWHWQNEAEKAYAAIADWLDNLFKK